MKVKQKMELNIFIVIIMTKEESEQMLFYVDIFRKSPAEILN